MKKNTNYYSSIGVLLGLSASSAYAEIVFSPTATGLRPPSVPFSSGANWDVDDDGTIDFMLFNRITTKGTTHTASWSALASIRFVVGAGFFGTAGAFDPFRKVTSGQVIGTGIPGYTFGLTHRAIEMTFSGLLGSDLRGSNWGTSAPVSGFVGFKFTNVSGIHYGYAALTVDGTTGGVSAGQGFIITGAWYETDADTAITVGAVPEPEMVATGLGVLALGAAGLRRWRARKG